MQHIIITNDKNKNLKKILSDLADKADSIKVATAFFSDSEFVKYWLDSSKQFDLLVSLRPPTNYYSLKNIYSRLNINIQFLGNNFHSKFFIFYKKGSPFACIIGSSNFTPGGLQKNIETNAVITDSAFLKEINSQFLALWKLSFSLQPTDLDKFKIIFDNFRKREEQTVKDQEELEWEILTKRRNKNEKSSINKEAKKYFVFWKIVDEVKGMVNDISKQEYPGIPVYISIDHFWHWVKVVWAKKNKPTPLDSNRNSVIPKLFKEYCDWDKSTGNYTKEMAKSSKTLFAKLLSDTKIDKLTKGEAKQIYANLHSGAMRTRRFGADEKFVTENSIKKIRASLRYLLYSNDELDLRIHNLCLNPDYKLNQFKSSGTQELIGWVTPERYPIRNNKADEALGYSGTY